MFDNIEAYYAYLEQDKGLSSDLNISKLLIKLRDKAETTKLKSICSYELFFTDYSMHSGKLSPQLTMANGATYPNLTLFDDDFKHIKARTVSINNPKYKAKYNHLLWESKHKHNDYAKEAVENYFTFLRSVSFPVDDNLSNHSFENYFENLFILCQSINYKKEEATQFLISLLGSKRINGYKEYSLMKFVAEEGKKIESATIQTFFNYCNSVIEDSIYPDFLGEYLQLQILLCQKLNVSPKPYHYKLGELHLAESEKQKENWLAHDYYLKALKQFQKTGDREKIEKVTVLVEKAKRNINFKTVIHEFTDERLQKLWEGIINVTDKLTDKGTTEDIYGYIMLSENIFPKEAVLTKDVRPLMFDLVSVVNFDINKNVSGNQKSGINQYHLHMQNFSVRHLWLVFLKGIKNGKVSAESLIDYLRNHSWYGQNFTYIDADGELEGFNWIELLSPSITSFFNQSEIDIKLNKNNNQGYILPIDSLVLKFEGLLREFSRNIGAQTIEIKENGTEERISFEKLLENEKLKEIIPADDIALFKFLFTSDGMNLRNNIAHCFYKTKNYSAGTMILLIAALLKLGNYKFKPKEIMPK